MAEIRIQTPLTRETAAALKAGDTVLISGVIYSCRDAAHKRFQALLDQGKELPFDIRGQIIYYAGPTPTPPGRVIGSAGPTTSYRMDKYTPALLRAGLAGMIGKGKRNDAVIEAMKETGAVYLAATGGAAALIARSIKFSQVICYEDLGAEALRKMTVEDFPAIVAIDAKGVNMYEEGRRQYEVK
ncbi:MAG: Fe-S-containing hydro-lyase [Peptococcaceae bacterium]|nr:Fe-S-containing hydro-lyase [Peptococcaceae bacterium]